jgi:hypothetical protein
MPAAGKGIIMKTRILLAITALGCSLGIGAAPAQAQATRTWVSGVGDDVNPCSRTAPCKTFSGAISKTAAGGEINCLDPAGYGAVTITKALTISCPYTEGGLLAAGNGIVVNAGPTDAVFLRGLDIFGVSPPTNGVRFIAGGSLTIQDCVIRRFNLSGSFGVSFQPSGTSQLFISNTTVAENGNASGTSGGVLVQPTGTGSARVTIVNSDISNNVGAGIRADSTGNTGASTVVNVNRTRIAGNSSGVVVNAPPSTTGVTLLLLESDVFNNGTALSVNGGSTQFAVGGSTIVGNIIEMSQTGGGALQSFGDNYRAANNVPGTFGGPAIPKS